MFFSVIVPIYLVEPYLRECVDSVLNQTFDDFELILVDDGSPDQSGTICDEYAACDARVKVIHKPNGGLVSARKAGIEIASGKYVVNIDGDDYVMPDLLMNAYHIACDYAPDIISPAVVYRFPKHDRTLCEPVSEGFYDRAALEKQVFPHILMDENMSHMFYYLCAKAIRRELVCRHQRAVNTGISLGEDVACLVPTYLEAQSLYVSTYPGYVYRYRAQSDSRCFKMIQYEQLLLGLAALKKHDFRRAPSLPAQIDRYGAFTAFALLNAAAGVGDRRVLPTIKNYMKSGLIKECTANCRFEKLTPKMRLVYHLFRHERVGCAYALLRLTTAIKETE